MPISRASEISIVDASRHGRKTHFDYSSTHRSALNRLDAIKDDNAGSPGHTLAEYTWLGLSTMVVEDFAQPDVKLDYFGGASGTYTGFDRFGRVIDQQWYDYGASAVRDQYTYGIPGTPYTTLNRIRVSPSPATAFSSTPKPPTTRPATSRSSRPGSACTTPPARAS